MSVEAVRLAKKALEARGEDLSGPCGAFKIVQLVAWTLRGAGYGLHRKTHGNNCAGFSTDYVVGPDGHGYDILIDAGGANEPTWNDDGPAVEGAWADPIDPGTPSEGPQEPPGSDISLEAVLIHMVERIEALETNQATLRGYLENALVDIDHLEAKTSTTTTKTTSRTWGHSHNYEV